MDTPKTRSEQHLETLMTQLEPDSPRYRVLASARQFKSSWVDLGEKLTRVHRDRLYREWGYGEFDDYCSQEIRIRRGTAEKLTRAYHFLETDFPERLAGDRELQPVPDFRAVDLLCRARQEALPADQLDQLQRAVFDDQRSLPTVRQQFNRLVEARASQGQLQERRVQSALQATRRLHAALAELPEQAGDIPVRLQELEARLAAALPAENRGEVSAEEQPAAEGQDQGTADAQP